MDRNLDWSDETSRSSDIFLFPFFFAFVPGCGRTFNGERGEIKSPNHPGRHPESVDCSYLICVARDKLVMLRFTHFDLEAPESELRFNVCFINLVYSLGRGEEMRVGGWGG